ncbi:hypothetical protein Tco_1362364 [Tanacetum coccineum]
MNGGVVWRVTANHKGDNEVFVYLVAKGGPTILLDSPESRHVNLLGQWGINFLLGVESIPLTFESEEHYFGSFVYPLLEEARSDLASSLEIMHRAPFADMLSFNDSTSGENKVYDVIVVDGKPESISDLKHVGRTWDLAMVKSKEDDSTSIRVKENYNICSFSFDNIKFDPHLLLNLNESRKTSVRKALSKDSYMCSNECGYTTISLTHAKLEYYSFIENEFMKEKQLRNENEDKRTMLEIKSFSEFVQERFNSLAPSLRRCILTFCTHILRNFMGESIFQNMISLLDNISSLESLLFHENLVLKELEDLFNLKPLQEDFVKSWEMPC